MIKRLLKKSSEQLVKKFEYHKVALQKELEQRQRLHQSRLRASEERHQLTEQLPPSAAPVPHSYPKTLSMPPPPPMPSHCGYVDPRYHHLHNGMYPTRGPHPSYPPSRHPPPMSIHSTAAGVSPPYHHTTTSPYYLPHHVCPPPYHSNPGGQPTPPILPPPSLPLSPPPPPPLSRGTSTTVRSNDVYNGSEETFV